MKFSFLRGLIVTALLGVMSLNVFAVEEITINQLREEVLDENIDIKIQYEKYYQAQQNIGVKLGEFLPNLNIQLIYFNSTYGVLYSVVPTPSNWFNYQASKELAIAEKHITESIKLNILRDLTNTYISIKHQELMMASMKKEEASLQDAYARAQALETVGMGSSSNTFTALRSLLQHQNDILALETVIAAHKEALAISLNRHPSEEIELADFDAQSIADIPATVEQAIDMALINSPELKANFFMQQAAQYMTRSARWSFVSFSGIGFGYPATVAIENSKLREIQLEGQKLENQIANQLDLAYFKINNLDQRVDTQNEILIAANNELQRVSELYELGQATLAELIIAQNSALSEERRLATLKMEKEIQINEVKRLIGTNASGSEVSADEMNSIELIANTSSSFRSKKVTVNLSIPANISTKVASVKYSGDIFDYRFDNSSGNYSLYKKVKGISGEQVIVATITFIDGQTLQIEKVIIL
ncbi:MAG: TolC family protein [Bdellovibrionota bacterium]|nr:TolC family protein [Bdellovibrionota bacterium]